MSQEPNTQWTFLTNHAHVLLCLATAPHMRMRDIAQKVGITERAVQKIIADLETEGFIEIKKEGRCNVYTAHMQKHLRHPIESHSYVADLLKLVAAWEEDT
ncbi:MAG: winged helix-turn-helix transcriptional regulator [Spirochaetales bacterium]|nr:winged helix-turn-helix transcriptional regulator [Spirochaetales bacterium]